MKDSRWRSVRAALALVDPSQRSRWVITIAVGFLSSLFEVGGAALLLVLLGKVTDQANAIEVPILGDPTRFIHGSQDRKIIVLCIVLAVFFTLRGLLAALQVYLQFRVAGRAGLRLARRLFARYLAMPLEAHNAVNTGQVIRDINEATYTVSRQAFQQILALVSEALVVIIMTAFLLLIAPLVTLAAVVFLGLAVAIVMRLIQHRLAHQGREGQEGQAQGLRWLVQGFEGYRDIVTYDAHDYFEDRFATERERFVRADYLLSSYAVAPRVVVETSLILFVLAFLGIVQATSGDTSKSVAVLGAFAYAGLRMLPALNKITSALSSFGYGAAAVDAVTKALEVLPGDAVRGDSTTPPLPFTDEIRLEQVTFSHANGATVLRDVDLHVPRGGSVGIVGRTGAGKSTLLDLVTGLRSPSAGRVLVDGVDIAGHEVAWRKNVAYVSQHIFLTDGTVRDNIAFGIEPAAIDEAAVLAAVEAAQLGPLVASLADGLDTLLGDRGVRLSGGERQRVALARAFYRSTPVIILDEGTSALDEQTETLIVEAIEALRHDHTLFIVSHRASALRQCDVVCELVDGRLSIQTSR